MSWTVNPTVWPERPCRDTYGWHAPCKLQCSGSLLAAVAAKKLGVTLDSNHSTSQHKAKMQSCIHTNHVYLFHRTPSHHSSTPNPCLFSCPVLVRRLSSFISRLPSVLAMQTSKIQNAAARRKQSDNSHPILQILHWLPVTNCIQCSISSASVPSLAHMIHIWHLCFCLLSCNNHKTFWWKSFSFTVHLFGAVCHSDSSSLFKTFQ